MNFKLHTLGDKRIAELETEDIAIQTTDDGLNLVGTMYFDGYDALIIRKEQITPDFFDLKNGMAGEILQKFSTYRIALVIVGDFSSFTSKSLSNFILESNKGKQVNFMGSINEALAALE